MQAPKNENAASPSRASAGVIGGLYGVSKFFDSFWGGNLVRALIEVSFEIRRGEVFGLLGPAGSGKSTAIKMFAGDLRPMEGRVQLFGHSPRSGSVKSRVGYVPERARTSRQTGGGLREAFNQLVGAGSTASRGAGIGLLQALRNAPDLLLLDNPFDGLDEAATAALIDELRALARKGKTVVLTTRFLSEAYAVCDRIAIFREGRVAAAGGFDDLFASPLAINLFAPVLPETMSQQLLQIIREQLEVSGHTAPAQQGKAPAVESGSLSTNASALSQAASQSAALPSKNSAVQVDAIDHQRLARLAGLPGPNQDSDAAGQSGGS